MPALRMRRRASRRVDLHQRDLRPRLPQFTQSLHVLFDLLNRRLLAVQQRKQALDYHRALPAYKQNVRQDLVQRTTGTVHFVHVSLRAGVDLGPDFVLFCEKFQAALDFRKIQPGRIGDEHDFEKGELTHRAHVHHRENGFDKLRAKRWFAVATEGDMAELEEFRRQAAITENTAQSAEVRSSERLS